MKYVNLLLAAGLMLTACAPIQGITPSPATPTRAAIAEEAGSLAGTQWLLTSFGTPGAETVAMEAAPITLEFSDDGQLIGSGGCNSYTGSYQVEGDTFTVGEVVSTLMACVDNDAMEQEIAYFDVIQLATAYDLTGDSLTIFYTSAETGEGQLTFTRASDSESSEPAPPPPATSTPAPEANTGFTPVTLATSPSASDSGAEG